MSKHIGPLPACPVTRALIAQRNALGYPTICADTYAAKVAAEPKAPTPQYAQARASEPDTCDLA